MLKDFGYYSDCFSNLHTARARKLPAPHKPLLLLAVMDLVERGVITSNKIELSDALIRAFKANAKRFIGHSIVFNPNIGQPFYHLQYEPFWELREIAPFQTMGMAADPCSSYGNKKPVYSIKGLREHYRHAVIDKELFELMQNEDARAKLRTLLIGKYLTQQPNVASGMAMVALMVGMALGA